MNNYPTILFILIIALTSCNGQNTKSSPIAAKKVLNDSIGEVVSDIDSSIWYIFQDKNNNHWFGSNGQGVYKHDGKTILRFSTKDGLPSNQIRGIQEDHLGTIFISCTEGISKFDGQKFTTLKPIESNDWKLNPDDLWFSILGQKDGNGVYRYDGKSLHHLKFPKHYMEDEFNSTYPNATYSPYEVYSICKDKRGDMWFGTAIFGLCRFDGTVLSWMFEDHLTNTPNGGSFGIRSMFEDRNANFWICNTHYRYQMEQTYTTKNGTNFIDYKRKNGMGQLTANGKKESPYFFSMIEDEKGNLWMTTYDQGVLKFDGKTVTQFPIKENGKIINLFSIYRDKQNNIWLGTHNEGVYKLNGQMFEKVKL